MRAVLATLLCATCLASAEGAGRPASRIVSMNLCTDSMLFELVTVDRIVSVTALSRDPNLSVFHESAAKLHVNYGHVEEVVALDPDLVIADSGTLPFTLRLLERLGMSVMTFAHANSFGEYRANLARLATATGTMDRARDILSRYPRVDARPDAGGPRALVYQPNGFAPGTATLMNAVVSAAGYRNVAAELGLAFGGFLSMESLLLSAPEIVITSAREAQRPSLAEAQLDHPALRHFFTVADGARRHVAVPERLWTCAGLHNLAAVALLREGAP